MTEERLCDVFKSLRHPEMYLFVDSGEGLARVPVPLLNHLGATAKVTTLTLTPQRKLARAKAPEVLAAIEEKGFYLQLPPGREQMMDASMMEVLARNEKLPR